MLSPQVSIGPRRGLRARHAAIMSGVPPRHGEDDDDDEAPDRERAAADLARR